MSGFCIRVNAICALLKYNTVHDRNSLSTFRDNLSWISRPLKMGPTDCPKISVRNYHHVLHNIAEGRRAHVSLIQWFTYMYPTQFTWTFGKQAFKLCVDVKHQQLHVIKCSFPFRAQSKLDCIHLSPVQ